MWPTLDSQHQTLDSVYHRKEWTELLSFANYSHTDGHGTRPLIRWQKPHMPVFSYTCYNLSRFSYSVLLNVIMEINLSRGKPRDILWGTMLDRLRYCFVRLHPLPGDAVVFASLVSFQQLPLCL